MLTDEELTTRLEAAFRADAPELAYAGPMPHVRRTGAGLAATGVLAAGAALALAPVALQRDRSRAPEAQTTPGHHQTQSTGTGRHSLRIAGLHLTYATTANQAELAYAVGSGLTLPPDAQKADLDIPAQVWFVTDPPDGQPQMYVEAPGTTMLYGVVAPGWTRAQLVSLLEHGDG